MLRNLFKTVKKKSKSLTAIAVQPPSLLEQPYLPNVPQQQVSIIPLPSPFQWEGCWEEGGLALLTDDGTEVIHKLALRLQQGGLQTIVLQLPGIESKKPTPKNSTVISLTQISDEAIGAVIQQIQQHGTPQLFIHLHPADSGREDIIQAVFWMAKYLQPIFHKSASGHSGFLIATRLNGTFGYGATTPFDWRAGGLSGITKSLNREWLTVFCRTIDLHTALAPKQVADCLWKELHDTDLALAEVGYDDDLKRVTLSAGKTERSLIRTPQLDLQPSDVVVVTGGARGITAQCTVALAQSCPCTFLLIGRTHYHTEEPAWAQGIIEEKALKQTIFKTLQQSGEMPRPIEVHKLYQQITSSRSIKNTLAAIHQAGGKAMYVEVDIMDDAAVQRELSALQAQLGKVTTIIHGAGALADKLVEKKTESDFTKVYGTKVQGLHHVMQAVDAAQLKQLVLFSSIAGFYGNEGQTDYALANDTLNKWAISYQLQHPDTKVTAINWGPWKTGMVTEYIQQEFEQRGVMLIQEEEGISHFLNLLSSEASTGITVVNSNIPPPKKFLPLQGQTLRLHKRVMREENPFLEHHIIGGYPVMPFVTGMGWIANAAEQLFPSYHLIQGQNSKLFNGIIFNETQASDYYLDLQVTQQDKQSVQLNGKVWSMDARQRRRYHYGGEVMLALSSPEQPTRELPTFAGEPLKTKEELYSEGSLFHGPAYQGMKALWQMNEQGMWYTCELEAPTEALQGQFPLQSSKTFATDAMCQGFLVWAYRYLNASCLPSSMGKMQVYEPLPFDKTFWVQLSITEQKGHRLVGSAMAVSPEGKLLMEIEGIAMTVSQELLAFYQKPNDSLAVVDMDIRLPGIQNLDAFHKAVYDGTLSVDLSQEAAAPASLLHKMQVQSSSDKALAIINLGTEALIPDATVEVLPTTTFVEALTATQRWLTQHPEGSVILRARHQSSQSEAIVRLMLSQEAKKTRQHAYASLSDTQPFQTSTLASLMPVLGYLDIGDNTSPVTLSVEQEVPGCALGILSVADSPLQDVSRFIKATLCLHYRFLPAFPPTEDITPLLAWNDQHFYVPESSFPWIPENTDGKRVAAMVFADAQSGTLLQLHEAEPPVPKSSAYLQQQDRKLILISADDASGLQTALDALEKEAASFSHQWAQEYYRQHQARPGKYTVSLIAGNQKQLEREIASARKGIDSAFAGRKTWQTPTGSYFSAEPLGKTAKIGFVYPGVTSAYAGMIKDASQLFPQYFDHYSTKIDQLHEMVHQPLMHPRYLQRPDLAERKAREAQFLNNTVAAAESSIAMSVFATHILRKEFNLQPKAALGYSMGNITMLFAMEVWGSQHLHSRVQQSPIFQPNPAFKDWTHWVLNAPPEQVKQQLASTKSLYLTFINTPENVIISGDRVEGEAWMQQQQHQYESMRVDLHHIAHCPAVNTMYPALQQIHELEVEQIPDMRFYSGATIDTLPLDKQSLAKNAADTYCQPVDFVSLVEKVYQDGINVFIEVGPKAWCSRLVGDILQDQPHVSMAINQKGVSDYRSLLQLSSVLCSHGIPLHLPFYDVPTSALAASSEAPTKTVMPTADENHSSQEKVSATLPTSEKPSEFAPPLPEAIPLEEGGKILRALNQACYVYQVDTRYYLSPSSFQESQRSPIGFIPALTAKKLGNPAFRSAHGVKYAYMAGAMANGIASEEMVIALGQQGLLGSFGAAGLSPERVEKAIQRIQETLPQGPYAFNLIHTPGDGALEMRLIDMYLRYQVRTLEASAFMELTPALVYYRVAGLAQDANGRVLAKNKIIAKISRSEVARLFMKPAPDALLEVLLLQKKITPEQAAWASKIPMADDITVEADSGGHTDQQPLVCALPEMIRLKDRIQQKYTYASPLRIGAAGGISTPASVVSAFALGADYVVTGSINQACQESGTSLKVKEMLAQASSVDVVLAPSADMFEMGVSVQVLKRGTFYANRAKKLYQIYTRHESLADLPAKELEKLEKQFFQKTVSEVWSEVETFFQKAAPHQLEAARQHPKKQMALIFRWYLGLSSKWAVQGTQERAMDYQIWCGPSMGAFNDWVKGSPMEALENRKVAEVAKRLLQEAALEQRMQLLKLCGVPAPAALSTETNTKLLVHV
ncbi:MAG: PfaD family polyunsaturated fatty acid/polyketide biosynthesis protein [Cyclobacteriaceae bacterium]